MKTRVDDMGGAALYPSIQIEELTTEQIGKLVGSIGTAYTIYSQTFVDNCIDGALLVGLNSEDDVYQTLCDLGITNMTHKRALCTQLMKLKTMATGFRNTTEISTGCSSVVCESVECSLKIESIILRF